MKRLTQKKLDKKLNELDYIVEFYRKNYSKDVKRDWRTYEQRVALRMKTVAKEVEPISTGSLFYERNNKG